MAVQTTQIQAMIAEIDEVLSQTSGFGLGWLTSRESTQQRQVLERLRSNLQALARQAAIASRNQVDQNRRPLESVSTGGETRSPISQKDLADLEALRQQRDALIQEIQQLEQQRQTYLSQPGQPTGQQQIVTEFLRALMGNLQETLTPQLIQTLSHLEAEFSETKLTQSLGTSPNFEAGSEVANITLDLDAASGAQELQKRQNKQDRLLKTLDSKLDLMFETLQRNIQKYRSSFGQGLEKMHRLSAETEAMLKQLSDRLEQLSQMETVVEEAATVAPLHQETRLAADTEETLIVPPLASESPQGGTSQTTEFNAAGNIPLPYAGVEWLPPGEAAQNAVSLDGETISNSDSIASDAAPAASSAQTKWVEDMAAMAMETNAAPISSPTVAPADASTTGDLETTDTISSLTDLLAETPFSQSQPPEKVISKPVSLEEDLLGVTGADTHADLELGFGSSTLQLLNEDLANLEPELSRLNAMSESSPMEDDTKSISPDEAESSAIPEEILTEFDELFGDSSHEENPTDAIADNATIADLDFPETDEKKK